MHPLERLAINIRRSRVFRHAAPLWNMVRPRYVAALGRFGSHGLERTINQTDRIRVAPELYNLGEEHEPAVWRTIMREVKSGSVVADVGASLGLYTLAFAKRVGAAGRVYAFEPDPQSLAWLKRNVKLNGLEAIVSILPYAVGDSRATVWFIAGRESESHMSDHDGLGIEVQSVALDGIFADQAIDLLKIDVEGFELHVLKGAQQLLSDERRAPRFVFIEVHPFAWTKFGTTSDSLLEWLHGLGYEVFDLENRPVHSIDSYGEIIARRSIASRRLSQAISQRQAAPPALTTLSCWLGSYEYAKQPTHSPKV